MRGAQGGNILPEDPRAAKLRPLSILLFGDSVDFRIVKFFCNLALDLEPEDFGFPGVEDRLKLQGICRTPKLTLAKYHISSVSFEGPYWNGINFPPLQSIQDVRPLLSAVATVMGLCSRGNFSSRFGYSWVSMYLGIYLYYWVLSRFDLQQSRACKVWLSS